MYMFDFMSIIFPIFFIFIFGMIIFTVFRGIKEWNHNNKQPILTVVAKIVSKRNHVRRNSNNNSTTYYVTFEVDSGDRMELRVPRNEYGFLVEGDTGKLTFQGTRFHQFERRKNAI